MIIVNVGHLPGSNSLEKVVTATLRAVFPYVMRDVVSGDNSLVMASTRPLLTSRLVAVAKGGSLPPDLDGLAWTVASDLGPGLRGGTVYTDDRAPVEWLTDLSIIRYATGGR